VVGFRCAACFVVVALGACAKNYELTGFIHSFGGDLALAWAVEAPDFCDENNGSACESRKLFHAEKKNCCERGQDVQQDVQTVNVNCGSKETVTDVPGVL